jgi:hypothetical protein
LKSMLKLLGKYTKLSSRINFMALPVRSIEKNGNSDFNKSH